MSPRLDSLSRLEAAELLDLCTRGEVLGADRRVIEILRVADPELDEDGLANLPVGLRDARLLALRSHALDAPIVAVVECPDCGLSVEASFDPEDLGFPVGREAWASEGVEVRTVRLRGREVVLRSVTAADLCAAESLEGPAEIRDLLLRRAVVSIDGAPVVHVDPDLAEEIETELERMDPLALCEVVFDCPECGRDWVLAFDPGRYLWEELEALGMRLMWEVAELARAFHWSESEILALPAGRRRRYLEMADAWAS